MPYAIYDYQFWIAFTTFFIAIFISFFLPGFWVMRFLDKRITVRNFMLSYCVGFVMWTTQGYIFGHLNLRFMTYLYLLAILIASYRYIRDIKNLHLYFYQSIKSNKLVASVIIVGMILQSLIMFGSGFMTREGVRFFGSNNVDGVMHLSYIQSMIMKFPPIEPGAYQLVLRNYHYWVDLNIAELARIWKIPPVHIFFQFLPLFISVITGIATYLLMRIWTSSKIAGLWALFFLYLGSDAAYLFMLYFQRKFGFYTPAIDNGITQFLNMPHAAAKMIFIASLIPFFFWIKNKKKKWGFLTVVLFASLIGFKVYFGIFAGSGLGIVVAGKFIYSLIKSKNKKIHLRITAALKMEHYSVFILLAFIVIAACIYLPSNSGSGGLLYYPLEWPKLFLGQNNLNVMEWWLRMQVYEEAGNIRNIIVYNAYAIFVCLVCIHGTRLLGLIPHKKLYKLLGFEHMLFFIPGIIVFHILGLFTLQAAGSFNVFNFFVVSGVVMSLFSAFLLYDLTIKNMIWAKVLIVVIVVLTLPRPIYEIYSVTNSIFRNKGALIPIQEIQAAEFIRQNTPKEAIIQSHPKNTLDSITPYISYFSERQTYITGITMIESHGQQIKPLQNELEYLFKVTDADLFTERAKKNNISYVYLQKDPTQISPIFSDSAYFHKIYENERIIVIKIK